MKAPNVTTYTTADGVVPYTSGARKIVGDLAIVHGRVILPRNRLLDARKKIRALSETTREQTANELVGLAIGLQRAGPWCETAMVQVASLATETLRGMARYRHDARQADGFSPRS
jgi:hypothetical protein